MKIESIRHQVKLALAEDIGPGDLSARLVPDQPVQARLICREKAVLSGRNWFEQSILILDPAAQLNWAYQDGEFISPNDVICSIQARAPALLSAERTALNFLQILSGTASLTARYVQAVAGTGVRILDTRKTIPGLRQAQKYAVRCGGGYNHRFGLFDALLIKENHIAAAHSIEAALKAAQTQYHDRDIEIEVENLSELKKALKAGADHILLDNFDLESLRQAVQINAGQARLEASGNVNLNTVRSIAETGINDISVGELTKSIQAVDFSLIFQPRG